jgi:hypothetical protein
VVAVNKFERRGGADALRDVARQKMRNREAFGARTENMACRSPGAVLPHAAGKSSTDAAPIVRHS